jgi:hypothetical protein
MVRSKTLFSQDDTRVCPSYYLGTAYLIQFNREISIVSPESFELFKQAFAAVLHLLPGS